MHQKSISGQKFPPSTSSLNNVKSVSYMDITPNSGTIKIMTTGDKGGGGGACYMEHDSPNTLAQKIHLRYHKINIK